MDKLTILATVLLTAALAAGAGAVPLPKAAKADMLVGAYYFPGWNRAERWYCIAASETAQHPLLGYYREGDPDAADWHIKWALEHGVSFFAFDFYTSEGSQMLEMALDEGFLRAKHIDRVKFCLNWCNHVPASEMTAEEFERFGDLVIRKYLTHPSYLRLHNKPVVMILSGAGFVKNLGVDGARNAFDRFEERCREAGLEGVYLVFCEGEIGSAQDMQDCFAAGTDAFCRYNYPYAGTDSTGPGRYAEATYQHLIEQGDALAKHWREISGGRFWPTVMPGWDRRPWTKDLDLIRTGSTPELFGEALRQAREYVNSDRVVLIEAWNEWGEGSVLEPSVEYGFAYLDQVRSIFCPGAEPCEHADPKSLGMRMPVFDLKLPSISAWAFDFDADGWTATGASGLASKWGALMMTSTTADPQLTSPLTYLDCEKHARMRIRMRAAHAEGGPEYAEGQMFWSTVETGLSEAASVRFRVPLDGAWHDHVLDLSANPRWKGRTDRFRLDPVDASGIGIYIDEIRLDTAVGGR